jgi:FMN-dependent NADH-azoreductase
MNILQINSSANQNNSISRYMVNEITEKLRESIPTISVKNRDVAYNNLPYLNQAFIEGMFNIGALNAEQQNALKISDELTEELMQSDAIVIGAPMYNFTIPSSLKSYFDLIARPGKTFQFNFKGEMKGLLKDKTAFVVITSGGTPIGGDQDHSAP